MNIKFNKLIIENFLSFGSAEIDLNDRGYTLVSGVNQNPDDNARSNGSGKSAIWDAISWAITGTTIRGITKDIVNIHNTGGCSVELYFSIDGHDYIIKRYKDHSKYGSTIKFFLDGQDISGKGIRDTEKIIQSTIPDVNSSLIGSVIILGQGLPQRFSNNTPSGRKEVLETLSKSDFMIDDIKKRLSARRDELNKELREVQDARLTHDSKIHVLESQVEENKKKLAECESTHIDPRRIEELEANISTLRSKIDGYEVEVQARKEEYLNASSRLKQLDYDKRAEYEQATHIYVEQQTKIKEYQAELRLKLSQKNSELASIEGIKDTCPTCGQKLPEVYKPNPEPVRSAIQKLTGDLNNSTKYYENLSRQIQSDIDLIDTKYDSIFNEISTQVETLHKKVQELQALVNKCKDELRINQEELNRLTRIQDTYEARKEELRMFVETALKQIEDLTSQNLYYIEKEESVKVHLDIVSKMITIATRDFRGYLLTNVIKFIDERAKEYSNDIFNTRKIQFILDGNNINIIYDDKLYESLSGGEKQRVDIIVQFALRDMLCQFSEFSCNILVLDELFDNLDSVGCDNVLNLITKRLTDIESVFIITHHSDISIPADSFITVYKDERGISSIR